MADEKVEESKGPVQKPIVNLYTDKVIERKAFEDFIQKSFIKTSSYTVGGYLLRLIGTASAYYLAPTLGQDGVVDGIYFSKHIKFLEKLFSFAHEQGCSYLSRGKEINDENWMIIRELMRFYSWDQMILETERNRLDAAGELYCASVLSSSNKVRFQREAIPYLREVSTRFKIEIPPQHFIHISPENASLVRFYPDEKALARDNPVETTITKAIKRIFPDTTDKVLQEIAELHKFYCDDGGVLFFDKAEDIRKVYQNGPDSCMSKGDTHYKSFVHPTAVYAFEGIKLAALPTRGNSKTFSARCFVYDNPKDPKDRRYIRVYGDTLLQRKLDRMGYKLGSWEGVKLAKLGFKDKFGEPLPGSYVMAYIDDVTRGNGTTGAAQCVYSDATMDHWIVCNNTTGHRLMAEAPKKKVTGAELFGGTATSGIIGKHVAYHPMRHNYYRDFVAGNYSRSDEPRNDGKENKWGELRCLSCSGIFDKEHFKPVRSSKLLSIADFVGDKFICTNCLTSARLSKDIKIIYPTITRGDTSLMVARDNLAFVHKESQRVFDVENVNFDRVGDYEPIFLFELEERGYVSLSPTYYPYGQSIVAKNENVTKYNGVWVKTEDLVQDVMGNTKHKHECWFLGQSSTGSMQYISMEESIIRKALTLGCFAIYKGKLEYHDKLRFSARKRKEYFSVIREFGEDEDDLRMDKFEESFEEYDKPFPFLDVLNALWAFEEYLGLLGRGHDGTSEAVAQQLRKIIPRANPNLLYVLVVGFRNIARNFHAGIDGVKNISEQIKVALLHGFINADEITFDPKTGEATLTTRGQARISGSFVASGFLHPSATRFIRFYTADQDPEEKRSKPTSKTITQKKKRAVRSTRLIEDIDVSGDTTQQVIIR